jgi:hypothetical protein
MESPNYVAGGNIYPSRIVVLDSSSDNTTGPAGSFVALAALAADASAAYNGRSLMGISMPGSDYPPLNDPHVSVGDASGNPYAAIAGEDLQVYGPGQVGLLQLATTVQTGQRVTAAGSGSGDSNAGKGTPVTAYSSGTPQQFVGIALQSGVAGEKILVFVQPGIF